MKTKLTHEAAIRHAKTCGVSPKLTVSGDFIATGSFLGLHQLWLRLRKEHDVFADLDITEDQLFVPTSEIAPKDLA